jgi:hypothetical protein
MFGPLMGLQLKISKWMNVRFAQNAALPLRAQ